MTNPKILLEATFQKRIRDFLLELRSCNNRKHFKGLVESLTPLFEFELWIALLVSFDENRQYQTLFTISTMPNQFTGEYIASGYDQVDPVFIKNFHSSQRGDVQVWSQTFAGEHSSESVRYIKFLSQQESMQEGMSVGHFEPEQAEGMIFSITGSNFLPAEQKKEALSQIAKGIYQALFQVKNKENTPP